MGTQVEAFLAFKDESSFLGYDQLELETEILALQDGKRVGEATEPRLRFSKKPCSMRKRGTDRRPGISGSQRKEI